MELDKQTLRILSPTPWGNILEAGMNLGNWSQDIPDGYDIRGEDPSLEESQRAYKPASLAECQAYQLLLRMGELGPENRGVGLNQYFTRGKLPEDDSEDPSHIDDFRWRDETDQVWEGELHRRDQEGYNTPITEADWRGSRMKTLALARDKEFSKVLQWVQKVSKETLRSGTVKHRFWSRLKSSRGECAESFAAGDKEAWSRVWLTKGQVDQIWSVWKKRIK